MLKIKKLLISALTAVLFVALLVSAVFLSIPTKTAFAMSDANTVVVGKNGVLTELAPNGVIDQTVLNDFYVKLAGNNAGLTEVIQKANAPVNTAQKKFYNGSTAQQLANNNIIVRFGGLDWTVVYLSLDRNGDPVATLWLKDTTLLNGASGDYSSSKFSSFNIGDTESNAYKFNVAYPQNRYSTSLIRSKLNLGTPYATSATAITTSFQSADHPLAVFTMTDEELTEQSSDKKSVMQYIDMPYMVPYQESLSRPKLAGVNDLNSVSSAYGIPLSGSGSTAYTHNARGFSTKNGGISDLNSYALNNYIVEKTGIGTKVEDGTNNKSVANNMGSSLDSIGLYKDSVADGRHWKSTAELFNDLDTIRTWTDAESWAFDTVWLPSLEEIDSSVSVVWKCTTQQYASSEVLWTRSGCYNQVYGSYSVLATNGGHSYGTTTNDWGIRPALHLNLKVVDNAKKLIPVPENLEYVYNGQPITVDMAAKDSAAAWYGESLYSSYIAITYDPGTVINAVTYDVSLKIKDTSKYAWFGDTSDTKKIKLTINKKKLKVEINLPQTNVHSGVTEEYPTVQFLDTGQILDRDKDTGENAANYPVLKLRYESTDGGGYNSTTAPTKPGKYKAVAIIENAATEGVNYDLDSSDGNYPTEKEFTIVKRQLTKPTISSTASVEYTAEEQEFNLSNYDEQFLNVSADKSATFADGVLKATDVNSYTATVKLKDSETCEWADTHDSQIVELHFAITAKGLTSTSFKDKGDNDPTVNFAGKSWGHDIAVRFTYELVGVLGDDSIELSIYYTKTGEDGKHPIERKGDTGAYYYEIPGLAMGSYALHAELANSSSSNKNGNYTLTETPMEFTVTASQAKFTASDLKWTYTVDGGGTQEFGDDHALPFINKNYTIKIKLDNLASLGVKLDDAYSVSGFSNGYSGDYAKKDVVIKNGAYDPTGKYTVKVHIVALNESYVYNGGDITFEWSITPAKYDLSDWKWMYKESKESGNEYEYTVPLEFKESNYIILFGTQELRNKYPNLDPEVTNPEKKAVAKYQSALTLKNSDPNYVNPVNGSPDTYTGDVQWTLDWEITIATLHFTWSNTGGSQQDGAGKVFAYPKVTKYENIITYEYYKKENFDAQNLAGSTKINLEDIVVDVTQVVEYYVVVKVKPENSGNYQIDSNGSDWYKLFSVGSDKNGITITLAEHTVTYDGQPHATSSEFSVAGSALVTVADITFTYYKYDDGQKGDSVGGAPTEAGVYLIEFTLAADKADDNAIISEPIEFTIEKASFDVSGLKWVYYHYIDGVKTKIAEYDPASQNWKRVDAGHSEHMARGSIIYDGTLRVIELDGVDDIDGLEIQHAHGTEHGDEPNGRCMAIDAGQYTVQLTFKYNENNYNAPDFVSTFVWGIAARSVDVSTVEWGIKGGDGNVTAIDGAAEFTYTAKDGTAQEVTLELMNVDSVLAQFLTYSGNVGGDVNDYTAHAGVNEGYKATNFSINGADLATKDLKWKITARTIDAPTDRSATIDFDGDEHNIVTEFLAGLDGSWSDYAEMKVTRDSSPAEGTTISKAGVYVVTLTFKVNDGGTKYNARWNSDEAFSELNFQITVEKLKIEISEWTGTGKNAVPNQKTEAKLGKFLEVFTADTDNSPVDDSALQQNVTYRRVVKVAAGYEDDINLYAAEGYELYIEFKLFTPDANTKKLAKPTIKQSSLVFNTQEQTFEIVGLDRAYMVVDDESKLTQRDAGEYSVKISLVGNACWQGESGDDQVATIELKFKIEVLYLQVPAAVQPARDYDGTKYTYLPDDFNALWMTIEGNVATDVGQYEAVIKIKEQYKGNVLWDDESTDEKRVQFSIEALKLPVPNIKSPDELTYKPGGVTVELDIEPEFEKFVEITGNKPKDAGEYTLTIKIKQTFGDNISWNDVGTISAHGIMVMAVDISGNTVTIDYTVQKAQLPATWNTSGAVPQINVPQEYQGYVDFEYTFTDPATGAQVDRSALVEGKNYSVSAKIGDNYSNNFEFVGGLPQTVGYSFDFGVKNDGGSGVGDWLKENWWWLVIILAVLLVLVIIIALISGARRRRREREMMQMFMRGQGGYQPVSGIRYDDRPMIVLQAPSGENGQLQLPAGITEETLANAIALAMQRVNSGGASQQGQNGSFGAYSQGFSTGYSAGYSAQQNYARNDSAPREEAARGFESDYAEPRDGFGAQNAQYGGQYAQAEQPNAYGQPSGQFEQTGGQYGQASGQYGQQTAQPFITPEPPQSSQTAQSAQQQAAQQQAAQSQPSQPVFTDNDGFYDSYKKSKYDDDDDEDD